MSVADRFRPFGTTIFTKMSALALEHGAINLGQGFPDWDGFEPAKAAAVASLQAGGSDQYPPSAGIPALRTVLAERYANRLGRPIDPATDVVVTGGCTEALAASFLGLVNPGDEVVLIEPYYDAYPVGVAMAGAVARHVTLRAPDFRLDPDELRAAFSPRTRAVVVNTPHNPTGRVLDRSELEAIAALCVEFDAIAIADEVYEELVYEGEHLHIAALPGMAERTVTLSSVGKTFSLTGWKVGWAVAPPELAAGVQAAHQYLTFTTPTPVQHGTVAALGAGQAFYDDLRATYRELRDLLCDGLAAAGFGVSVPAGTYFVMADYRSLSDLDDRAFAHWLVREAGVVSIPPSVFYADPARGNGLVRFAFCKRRPVLEAALERLAAL